MARGVPVWEQVWSEQDQEPPIPGVDADASMFSECVEVRYDAHPTSSLSNRFAPLADLRTQAVFNVDDDVNVLCKDLAGAHKVLSPARLLRRFYGYAI